MKKSTLLSLVVANLVPVLGIFIFDWDLFSILFYYWLESAVVGIYNIPRMWLANPDPQSPSEEAAPPRKSQRVAGILFFLFHYSAFMAGHGLFIFELFSPVDIKITTIILGFVALGISHGVSFFVNFIGHKEYKKVSVSEQMIAPYKRIVVMHITIIFCGFILSLFGSPLFTLVLLVIFKIVIDVYAHRIEHTRLGTYLKEN